LTPQQVQMLDKIWSFETSEELNAFRETLPVFRKQELDTLVMMLIMEIQEQQSLDDVSLAQSALHSIGIQC